LGVIEHDASSVSSSLSEKISLFNIERYLKL
jgi:hypothetical protein